MTRRDPAKLTVRQQLGYHLVPGLPPRHYSGGRRLVLLLRNPAHRGAPLEQLRAEAETVSEWHGRFDVDFWVEADTESEAKQKAADLAERIFDLDPDIAAIDCTIEKP